jgi:hypothetical protein
MTVKGKPSQAKSPVPVSVKTVKKEILGSSQLEMRLWDDLSTFLMGREVGAKSQAPNTKQIQIIKSKSYQILLRRISLKT